MLRSICCFEIVIDKTQISEKGKATSQREQFQFKERFNAKET